MYYVNIHDGIIILSSASSRVEIWPSEGAILNGWQANLNGEVVQVIDGYDSFDDFANNAESKGFRSCKLSPYVCRLHNGVYTFKGKEFHIGKFKLNGSSIHGLLYDEPFELVHLESTEDLAMVILKHHYHATDAGYPYQFELLVTYTLTNENKITIASTVTNLHHSSIPLADGWHPYFALGAPVNELELQIASDTMVMFNELLIPNGELEPDTGFTNGALLADTELDNCFLLQKTLEHPACTLTNKQKGIRLSIYANKNYPYLQMYIPPHRNSIAIENLSAAPDAFNNKMGLIMLDPGESISFSASYEVGAI